MSKKFLSRILSLALAILMAFSMIQPLTAHADEVDKSQTEVKQTVEQKPEEKKPEEQKPEEQKPEEQKPEEQKPEEQKPEEQKPEEQKPEEQKPEEQKPEEQKPEEQKPEEQKPEEQKPEEQKPEEQKPEEQKPEEQKPEEQKPEEQKPEEQKPEEEKPEEEKPEEQKPEEQKPEEEQPEEEEPKEEEPKKIEAGAMQADAERNALDENGGFYFTMDKNDIPLNEDVDEDGNSLAWNNTFAPTADDCIVIIRGEDEIHVGIPENAVLVKYSETGYYLKTASGEEKLLADALKPGDVIVIRGDFTNGNTTFTVAESLIFVGEDGSLTIEAVPESGVMTLANGAVVDLNTGSITTSSGNITTDAAGQKIGITFATDANDAPSGWNDAGMYKPTDANCIQIIRGGRTYSVANTGTYYIVKNTDNEYYLKTETWMLGEAGALQEGDVIVIRGQFVSVDGATTLSMGTSYITVGADSATFSTEDPNAPTGPSTVDAGTISAGNGGYNVGTSGNKDGIYFTMAENSAPSGWTEAGFYIPAESTCIKLIRGGKTYDVANTGTYYIVKSSATEYYLKTEAWMLGGQGALQEGDILVIEGKFTSQDGKTVLNMGTSYVTIGADSATFTQDDPTAPTGPSTVDAGTINAGNGGYNVGTSGNKDGIYFTMAENSAPSGWDDAGFYVPAESTCIKLIRGGKTYEIANTGTYYIVKTSATEYYLKTEAWMLGGQGALQEGDILVIGGKFTSQDGKTVLNMGTSYVTIGADSATFTQDDPTVPSGPDTVKAGTIKAGTGNINVSDGEKKGIYFTMDANAAPSGWNDAGYYIPSENTCIQVTRGGKTYNVAMTGTIFVIKQSDTEYYLKTETWMLGELGALQTGDIITIGGKFTSADGKTILNMDTSYISVGTNTADFSTTMPEPAPEPTIVNAGAMQADSRGKSSEGLYFKLSANDAPFNPDWTESYTPASVDCIKLIRDGRTYSIGNIAAGTIIKYSETEYYLKTEKWMMSDVYPIRDGDILLVEGNFLDAKGETALSFSSNYISMEYGSATFSETYPDGSAFNKVETGMMGEDSWKDVTNGVSFTLADNQAPGNPDWSLMYTPATESCIQLVRGGVTYNVAIPGRGTIVKFDDNRYYIKADNWAMGEYAPLREDDVLIVSGDFVNSENGYVLSIPTNYIGIYWERPYFYDTMPTEKPAKPVTEKPSASRGAAAKTAKDWTTFEKFAVTKLEKDERGRTPTGIYFRGAENDAPFKEDWTALYSPVDSACVKLIRDGVVYEIGIPGRGTIVKFGSAEFYLKTETWNLGDFMPLQEGDVLVLEGEFESQEEEAVLSIEQTFFFVRGRKVLIEDAAGENAKPMVELLNSAKA